MIIPIRCMTCGKVIADMWEGYQKKVQEAKLKEEELFDEDSVLYVKGKNIKKTIEGKVLDELNLRRYCCRRMFLTQADIVDKI